MKYMSVGYPKVSDNDSDILVDYTVDTNGIKTTTQITRTEYEIRFLESCMGTYKRGNDRSYYYSGTVAKVPRKRVHRCAKCNSLSMAIIHSTTNDFTAITGLKDMILFKSKVPLYDANNSPMLDIYEKPIMTEKFWYESFVLCHHCFYSLKYVKLWLDYMLLPLYCDVKVPVDIRAYY